MRGPLAKSFSPLTTPLFVPAAGGGGGGTEFITSVTLGSLRNDFTGNVGFKFQVGSSLTITHLGRWVVSGNSDTHTVTVRSAGAILGSVSVNTSGAPAGAFRYVALGTPVTVSPGGDYFLISSETGGGDQWGDNNTAITCTTDGTLMGSCVDTSVSNGVSGISYVPPSFKY